VWREWVGGGGGGWERGGWEVRGKGEEGWGGGGGVEEPDPVLVGVNKNPKRI